MPPTIAPTAARAPVRRFHVTRAAAVALAMLSAGGAAPVGAQDAAPPAGAPGQDAPVAAALPAYVPHRVFRTAGDSARLGDLESMIAAFAAADVVFLGEQHDDPGTHRLQRAVLEGLARRRGNVVLSLEMFERDVQPALDAFLAGDLAEAAFLDTARPWPNYAPDYRPLVTWAKEHGWPVVAANVPRRLARVVSRGGLEALDTIPIADLAFVSRERSCPRDAYWERFRETMAGMAGHGGGMPEGEVDAMIGRFYGAQCIKDETMAESIVDAHRAAPDGALVVHVNGRFHSDFGLGTADRVRRRLGDRVRMAIATFEPAPDLDAVRADDRTALADWVVFTLQPPPADEAASGETPATRP